MCSIKKLDDMFLCFPKFLSQSMEKLSYSDRNNLKEIRLYANKNIILCFGNENKFLKVNGQVTSNEEDDLVKLTQFDIDEIFKAFCDYSVHSYLEEISKGFITIKGGHRVGVYGTVVIEDNKITSIKEISSLNIRVAREVSGCSDFLFERIFFSKPVSTLIVGVPNSGKTTILRDIVKNFSKGKSSGIKKVSVIDERGEITSMYAGESQNDLGYATDVYNLCPKEIGIEMALRAGSPDIIVCDEIGSDDDVDLMLKTMLSGVKVVATTHAGTLQELMSKTNIMRMLSNNVFEKIVLLDNTDNIGHIQKIIDVKSEVLI